MLVECVSSSYKCIWQYLLETTFTVMSKIVNIVHVILYNCLSAEYLYSCIIEVNFFLLNIFLQVFPFLGFSLAMFLFYSLVPILLKVCVSLSQLRAPCPYYSSIRPVFFGFWYDSPKKYGQEIPSLGLNISSSSFFFFWSVPLTVLCILDFGSLTCFPSFTSVLLGQKICILFEKDSLTFVMYIFDVQELCGIHWSTSSRLVV